MIFHRRILLLCWVTAALLISQNAMAKTERFALVIGNNEGLHQDETLKYARRDAQKMHHLLTQLGRFPSDNTTLLLEPNAKEAWAALKNIEKKAAALKKEGIPTLLLFYYSGHASNDALEMKGTELHFSRLRNFLENSSIQVRLAFVDSCHSGQLIAAKGAKKGKAFQIKVNDEISSAGYAIITSSSQNELSRESAELRGAFFTHHLISALRGSGDTSKDGKVTLQEAYEYAYGKTLVQSVGSAGAGQHPMYHFQLKGKGEIVLTHISQSHSSIELNTIEKGRVLLMDGIGSEVLAEADAAKGESIHFSVPPGGYIVYLVKPNGVVRMAETDVPPHERISLGPDDFSSVKLTESIPRGGLFRVAEKKWHHKVGIFSIWRSGPIKDVSSTIGAGAHYRLQHESGIQPTLRISAARAWDDEASNHYRDLGVTLGVGYTFKVDFVYFRTEVLLGYEHLFQQLPRGDTRISERPHSGAFSGVGSMGLEFPISSMYIFIDGAAGLRVFQIVGSGWVPRFEFQALLGIGFQWGSE